MSNKRILCLDFDGVVHSYTSGWQGARVIPDPPVVGALDFILRALAADYDVVIHSSRARYWGGIRAMQKWLRLHGGGAWHESPIGPGLESVRFSKFKPSAFLTIDDRAMQFRGTWPELAQLTSFRPWKQQAPTA